MNFQSAVEAAPAPEKSGHMGFAYEAPTIESVLTAEDLEREVHYAGTIPVSQVKQTN